MVSKGRRVHALERDRKIMLFPKIRFPRASLRQSIGKRVNLAKDRKWQM